MQIRIKAGAIAKNNVMEKNIKKGAAQYKDIVSANECTGSAPVHAVTQEEIRALRKQGGMD